MSTSQDPLILTYIGDDSWSRPVYRDQFQHLWKDTDCGRHDVPSLHPSVNDEFEGEPDMPIQREFILVGAKKSEDKRFQYMMLDRLRCDCDYYLGYGNRNEDILCGTPQEHIECMKKRWLEFADNEKPERLTWEQILEYERQMCTTPDKT